MEFASDYVFIEGEKEKDDDYEKFEENELQNSLREVSTGAKKGKDKKAPKAEKKSKKVKKVKKERKPKENPKKDAKEKAIPDKKPEKSKGKLASLLSSLMNYEGKQTVSVDRNASEDEAEPQVQQIASNASSDAEASDSLDLSQSSEEEIDSKETRKVRKADTNVVSVNLGTLAGGKKQAVTGDPLFCVQCKAIFSHLSKHGSLDIGDEPKDKGKSEKKDEPEFWRCEFCGFANPFELVPEEIPTSETVDYLLEPPAKFESVEKDSIVVFCIDTSGSMCCTSEIPGKFEFKKKVNKDLEQFMEDHQQQESSTTYVSRLQCVQSAVDSQLDDLTKRNPSAKVILVTFSNEVVVHDASGSYTFAGDILHKPEQLTASVADKKIALDQPIVKTKDKLSAKLFELEERGQTALGPALVVSLALAGKKPGSMIILATDGMANIGVGSIEWEKSLSIKKEDFDKTAQDFYDNIGNEAKNCGVAVSILSIKGTDCRLEFLAPICVRSNGFNNIVDPLDLTKDIGNILQNPVIATKVQVNMMLHKDLEFRHEEKGKSKNKNVASREIGNATKETTVTFEYRQRKDVKKFDVDSVPFQVQIFYTGLDGSKLVRTLTHNKKVTQNRSLAEEHVNVHVVGMHAVQESSRLAREGKYTKARMKQITTHRMVSRAVGSKAPQGTEIQKQKKELELFEQEAEKLDSVLRAAKKKELRRGYLAHSAEEDESCSDDEDEGKGRVRFASAQRSATRKEDRDDEIANALYQQTNAQFSNFTFQ